MATFDKVIKLNIKGVEQSIKSVSDLGKFVKQVENDLDSLDDIDLLKLKKTFKDVGGQLNDISNIPDNLIKKFKDVGNKIEEALPTNSIKSFKLQIQELEEELEGLEIGSESFNKVKAQADKLKLSLETTEQSALESREAMINLGKASVESFIAASGAVSLFTSGQEEADKIMAKFAQTMIYVDAIEKAGIAIKEVDLFLTKQQAAGTFTLAGAQTALATAINTTTSAFKKLFAVILANPLTALIGAIVTLTAITTAYFFFSQKSVKELAEGYDELNARIKATADSVIELEQAQKNLETSKLFDVIERENNALNDQIAINRRRLEEGLKQEKIQTEQLANLRKQAGDSIDKEELKAIENAENNLNTLKAANKQYQTDIINLTRELTNKKIDIEKAELDAEQDLLISRLSLNTDFNSKRRIIDAEYEKVKNDIQARELKGETVLATEKEKLQQEYFNNIRQLNIEYNNFLLQQRNEQRDIDLSILATRDDISARLQEILINEQKARDELNTRIINGELITGNEIKKINQDTANAKLLIQKELLNKIKELNNTSKQNEFDILAQNLSEVNGQLNTILDVDTYNKFFDEFQKTFGVDTLNIFNDYADGLVLIEATTKKALTELTQTTKDELSTIINKDIVENIIKQTGGINDEFFKILENTKDLTKEQIDAISGIAKVYNTTNEKIVSDDRKSKKELNTTTQEYVNNFKLSQQQILDVNTKTLEQIFNNEKNVYSKRIEAIKDFEKIQIKSLKLQRDIELQRAKDLNLSEEQINEIKARYNQLIVDVVKQNEDLKNKLTLKAENPILKSLGLDSDEAIDKFNKGLNVVNNGIDKFKESLGSLTEIKALSKVGDDINDLAIKLNNLGDISTAVKGLTTNLETILNTIKDKGKITAGELATSIGAALSTVATSVNNIIQRGLEENLKNLDIQLEKINERKAELDADLSETLSEIDKTRSALAEAKEQDQERLIKILNKQRKEERRINDEKEEQLRLEKQIAEEVKAIKKKQFEANKLAAIIQTTINTAIAVTNALGSAAPPYNFILAGIVGGLGAAQIAITASQPTPEFKTGGFTEKGGRDEVAGIVHKGEQVAPKQMVESPKFKNTIVELENSRTRGFAEGGFTSSSINEQLLNKLDETLNTAIALNNRPVVVSVQEINSVSNDVRKTQVRSSL